MASYIAGRPFTHRSMNTTELLRRDQMPGDDYATDCRKEYFAAEFSYSISYSVAKNNIFKSKWKVIEHWRKFHNRNLNNLNTSSNASRMQNQIKIRRQVIFKSKWKVTEHWKKFHNRNLNNLNTSSNASRMQNQIKISRQVM